MPAFNSVVDCTPWVTGGLWPAELSTLTAETALLAEYLKADLERIARSANHELKVIKQAGLAESARQAQEGRVIDEARVRAERRVESTLRQLQAATAEAPPKFAPPHIASSAGKPNVPKAEVSKAEVPQSDFPKSDVHKSNVSKSNVAKSNVAKSNVAKTDIFPVISAAPKAVEARSEPRAQSRPSAPPAPRAGAGASGAMTKPAAASPPPVTPPPPPAPPPVAPTPPAQPAAQKRFAPPPLAPTPAAEPPSLPEKRLAPSTPSDTATPPAITAVPEAAAPPERPATPAATSAPAPPPPAPPPRSVPPPPPPPQPAPKAPPADRTQTESDNQRLHRLLDFVARQEPRLNWVVGDRSDGTTVLTTDLAHGWIPPVISLPEGVRLLEPSRRSGRASALIGETRNAATYAPGDSLGRSTELAATHPSLEPRMLPPIQDLGWELGEATHWRDGVPRMVHTLAKAAAAGTGIAEEEVDVLRVHLDTTCYQLLVQYPNVEHADLLNCLLLAATQSIVTGDSISANYHYAWFHRLNAPPSSLWTPHT